MGDLIKKDKEVVKAVNTSKNVKPVAIIPVGYAAGKPTDTQKTSANEIVQYETF